MATGTATAGTGTAVTVTAAAGTTSKFRRFLHESVLACVVGSLILPNAIAIATVALFLTAPTGDQHHWDDAVNRTTTRCVFFGAVAGIAFVVLLAVVALRRFTRADAACPDVYAELHQGYDHVKERIAAECGGNVVNSGSSCAEATEHCAHLDKVFADPPPVGIPWLVASGYLDAWRRLHAAEEALIALDPEPSVVSGSLDDEMRLEGSTIPQSTALQNRLRLALKALSPSAASYFLAQPTSPTQTADGGPPVSADDEARAVLAQVRSSIDGFRDGRREDLVRSRNRLFATVLIEGVTGCVLLVVAILSGVTQKSITAVAAFFLIGGIVGLVKALQIAATSDNIGQDDYGLGIVRLIQVPLLSGLTGVGGVVLVQLTQGQGGFKLEDTFDLKANPYGLVAAAIFGLAPAAFLAGVQARVEKYKSDLTSSSSGQATQGTAKTT